MSTKQVIVMRTDLNMRKGKMCAQAAHASLGVLTKRATVEHTFRPGKEAVMRIWLTAAMCEWLSSSFKKVTVRADSEAELLALYEKARELKLPTVLIEDSGLTEFAGIPTNTCIAIGPAEEADVDMVTGKLKLL